MQMAKEHFMKAHPKEAKMEMEKMSEEEMAKTMTSKIKEKEEDM